MRMASALMMATVGLVAAVGVHPVAADYLDLMPEKFDRSDLELYNSLMSNLGYKDDNSLDGLPRYPTPLDFFPEDLLGPPEGTREEPAGDKQQAILVGPANLSKVPPPVPVSGPAVPAAVASSSLSSSSHLPPSPPSSANILPAYCDPPNPCPIGYTQRDGCIEDFENTSDFSRRFQASQNCICDTEHMFSCARSGNDEDDDGEAEDNFMAQLKQINANPFMSGQKLPVAAKKGMGI